MVTMRLGWEIPNPISIETENNNKVNYFPFAIITKGSGATVLNDKTLTLTVTNGSETAVAGATVFVGGNRKITNTSGVVTVAVQPNQTYTVDVFADGYYNLNTTVDVGANDKDVTLTVREYERYYGISSVGAETVSVPQTLKQTSTDKPVTKAGKGSLEATE